jgi:hypothetical protein
MSLGRLSWDWKMTGFHWSPWRFHNRGLMPNGTQFVAERRKPSGSRVEHFENKTGRFAPHRYLEAEVSSIGLTPRG